MAGLYDHPISHDYVMFIIVMSIFTALSGFAIVLRFLSRNISSKFGVDDWTILAAYICALGFLTVNVLAATIGMAGYPVTDLDLPHLVAYLKCLLANNFVYNASITLSKVSIVLMYRRIFTTPTFLKCTWPVLGLLAGFYIAIIFGEIFAYNPVHGQWNPTIESTHIDIYAYGLSMAGITIFLDVLILTMPQFVVWRLQMSNERKVLVSIVFLLGGLVCIASIVRLYYLTRISYDDPTYTLSVAGIWTAVEVNMAIICACLPTLSPIMHRWFARDSAEKGGSAISSYIRGKIHGWRRVGYSDNSGSGVSKEFSDFSKTSYSADSTSNLRPDGANSYSIVTANQTDKPKKSDEKSSWIRRDMDVSVDTENVSRHADSIV